MGDTGTAGPADMVTAFATILAGVIPRLRIQYIDSEIKYSRVAYPNNIWDEEEGSGSGYTVEVDDSEQYGCP